MHSVSPALLCSTYQFIHQLLSLFLSLTPSLSSKGETAVHNPDLGRRKMDRRHAGHLLLPHRQRVHALVARAREPHLRGREGRRAQPADQPRYRAQDGVQGYPHQRAGRGRGPHSGGGYAEAGRDELGAVGGLQGHA